MYTLKDFYCFLRKAKQYSDAAKGRFTNKAILAELEAVFSDYDRYYGIEDFEWKEVFEATFVERWYIYKSQYITLAIKAAKENNIKVTFYNGVIYFDTPTGQASFHDPKRENKYKVEYKETQWCKKIGGTDTTINKYFNTITEYYTPFNN